MSPEAPSVTVSVEGEGVNSPPVPAPEVSSQEIANAADQVVLAAQTAVALAEGQSALAMQDAAIRAGDAERSLANSEEELRWLRQTVSDQSLAMAELSSQVTTLSGLVSQLTIPAEVLLETEELPMEGITEVVEPETPLVVVEENPAPSIPRKKRRLI